MSEKLRSAIWLSVPWLILSITLLAHINSLEQLSATQVSIARYCTGQEFCIECEVCRQHRDELRELAKSDRVMIVSGATKNYGGPDLTEPPCEKGSGEKGSCEKDHCEADQSEQIILQSEEPPLTMKTVYGILTVPGEIIK